ncbi:MAG: exopolysaccharide biosynthesis polyprenyl glycosylphosphotransferase, partial [Alphaproteobacteria bacterium]|nr:exopolysaccharide biosynthesis polyprenyl glycosylphosphotransferase [Alphaproteobacteria bacterium]
VRLAARTLDILAVSSLSLLFCAAAGVDLAAATLTEALPFALLPAAGVAGVWLSGGYRFRYGEPVALHLLRIAAGVAAATAIAGAVAGAADTTAVRTAGPAAAATAVTLFALHANYLAVMRALTRAGWLSDNVVIVGATGAAARIVAGNRADRELNILGYFDDRADRAPADMGDVPFLGDLHDLLSWDRLPQVDRIVITVTSTAQLRVRRLIDRLRNLPQEIILVLDLDGFAPEHTSLARVVDAPAAYISGAPKDLRRAIVKRTFDIAVAGACLVAFILPMAVIAAAIRLDSAGPVFFRQKRHGFNNEIVRVWKFRTMRPDKRAEEGVIRQTVHDDPRVTRIGRFLRAASLDELPQLINILAGEMSLVGPRPHAVGMTADAIEVHRIVADYAHRHRMKPGLTGWAQVNGSRGPVHTTEAVRERVALDMEYVSRASVWLDVYILAKTIPRLLGDFRKVR